MNNVSCWSYFATRCNIILPILGTQLICNPCVRPFQRGTALALSPDASAWAAAQEGNGRASSEERPPKILPCWSHNRKVHNKTTPCPYGVSCRVSHSNLSYAEFCKRLAPPSAVKDGFTYGGGSVSVASSVQSDKHTTRKNNPFVEHCAALEKGDCANCANCGLPHLTSAEGAAKQKERLAKKSSKAADNGNMMLKAKANAKAKGKSRANEAGLCVLVIPDITAPGIQNEHRVKYITQHITFNTKPDVTKCGVGGDNATRPVSSKSSDKEGRYFIPNGNDQFALPCAIKRTRQLHGALTGELQDDVVCGARKLPNCDHSCDQPVRLDRNAPLQDVEGNDWRTSGGMTSCWDHTSVIETNTALHHIASHIMGHDVSLDATTRKHITNLNKAFGIVVSGADTADDGAVQPAMPGYVNHKCKVASNFGVSESWLVDTGCPNDLVSEEHSSKRQDCVYDAKAFNFNTANGHIGTHTRLNMTMPILTDTTCAFVLPQTHSALSVGEHQRWDMMSCGWLGEQRCWLTPFRIRCTIVCSQPRSIFGGPV